MKFLVDAQLPELLCEVLAIQAYADAKMLCLITKDKDFYLSHILFEKPKQLFFISVGNLKNRTLFDLFRKHKNHLLALPADVQYLELTIDGLIITTK
jgi:predicted nuclease of predicted toxin-antitoxin system